jgi:protein involved in polysaccharide export with SLBB domain
MTGLKFPFPQIATGDLDIPIVGQLPAAHLTLGQ